MEIKETSILFPAKLLEYRVRKGWSQATLAAKIVVDEETVRRWEKGETRPNKFAQQKLREVFNATSEELGLHENPRLKRTTLAPTAGTMPVSSPVEYVSSNPQDSLTRLQEQTHKSHFFLFRGKRVFVIPTVGLVIILCLLALWRSNVFPGMSYKTGTSPTPSSQAPYHIAYSFEDGTDQWFSQGPILSMQSSSDYAKDGRHALKVTFTSHSGTYPFIGVVLPTPLMVGQTFRMSVYVPTNSPIVSVHLFAQDQAFGWSQPLNATNVAPHQWVDFSYTIPSTAKGSITDIGVQFGTTPYNVVGTIYIDAVGWN